MHTNYKFEGTYNDFKKYKILVSLITISFTILFTSLFLLINLSIDIPITIIFIGSVLLLDIIINEKRSKVILTQRELIATKYYFFGLIAVNKCMTLEDNDLTEIFEEIILEGIKTFSIVSVDKNLNDRILFKATKLM